MLHDFSNTAFEDDAHLIFDNDGVQSELSQDREASYPNRELINHIRSFLRTNKNGKYSTLSGRNTPFLHSRKLFDNLLMGFPKQSALYGFYGNQCSVASHRNATPEILKKYKEVLLNVMVDVEEELKLVFEEINAFIVDSKNSMTVREFLNLIIEDKDFSLGIHQRQLIAHINSLNPENEKLDGARLERINILLSKVVENVIQTNNNDLPHLKFKAKYGKLVTEIFPDHEQVADDKVQRFKTIYEEHLLLNDASAIYYFGDDLGDFEIFNFCINNRLNSIDPRTYFIFVDSSTSLDKYDPQIAQMKDLCDYVVSRTSDMSAVENLADITAHKISLGLTKHFGPER